MSLHTDLYSTLGLGGCFTVFYMNSLLDNCNGLLYGLPDYQIKYYNVFMFNTHLLPQLDILGTNLSMNIWQE